MVLVAGSTGMLGSEICRLLAKQGEKVRALARPSADAEAVKSISAAGAEIVRGDLRDPASLGRACQGANAVISTVSSMPSRYLAGDNDIDHVDLRGVKSLIDAARQARAGHFLFLSFTADNPFPLRDAKRSAEAHLKESGMTWTVLQASFFMETWLSPMVGFDYAKAAARVYGTGEKPVSYISYRDVARIAVASLKNSAAKDAVVRIGGPEAISQRRAIHVFEEAGSGPFTIEVVPESALAAQQEGAADPMQQSFAGLMRALAGGDRVDMSVTAKTFGVSLKTVQDYAREVLTPVPHR